MTDRPTIRIKCDETVGFLAFMAGKNGLTLTPGESAIDRSNAAAFYVKRTKTGVSVRQIIDGRAV